MGSKQRSTRGCVVNRPRARFVITFLLFAAAGESALAQVSWTQVPPLLEGRTGHAMAFDEARNQLVLFGGLRPVKPGAFYTWLYDGTTWTRKHLTNSPPARSGHSMAYDPFRKRVVLFGGKDAETASLLNDTWEWDGSSWTQITTAQQPSPRHLHRMVYHRSGEGGEFVLFGGATSTGTSPTVSFETWVYDGYTPAAWTLKNPPTVPNERAGHSMTHDVTRGRTVLFGGFGAFVPLHNDTWEWDGSSWTKGSPATSPPARHGHASVFRPTDSGNVTVFGGGGRDAAGLAFAFGDTWTWNGTNWTNQTGIGPSPRLGHAMGKLTGDVVGLVGGGRLGTSFSFEPGQLGVDPRSDMWMLGSGWSVLSWGSPPPRRSGAMSMAPNGTDLSPYLFGGSAQSNLLLSDTWRWEGNRWVELALPGAPPPRVSHQMVYDSTRNVSVLFGGKNHFTGVYLPNTWEFDGVTWSGVATPGPARDEHAMAFDSGRGRTVLFGGSNASGTLGDTWEWNGQIWSLRATTGPQATRFPTMAYDVQRAVTVLWIRSAPTANALWEWNGTDWTPRPTSTTPPPLASPKMVYDSARGRIVMMMRSGSGFPARLESWELFADPTTGVVDWVKRTPVFSAPEVFDTGLVYDTVRRKTTLFGGIGLRRLTSQTWEYGETTPAQLNEGPAGCGPSCNKAPGLSNLPWIGHTFTTEVSNVPPGAGLFLYYGLGLLGTPITISPGCFFYATPDIPIPLLADAQGVARSDFLINPVFLGTTLFNQAHVLTASPNTVSNVLDLVVGAK